MEEQRNLSSFTECINGMASVEVHSRLTDALLKLTACVRSIGLYGRSHPLMVEMVESAHQSTAQLLIVQPTITIGVAGSTLGIDSFPIEDSTGILASLATMLSARKIGEFRLTAGVTLDEIMEMADVLSMSPEDLMLRGGASLELSRRGSQNIRVKEGDFPTESREGRDPADVYEEALLLVEECMRAVQSGLEIPVPEIRSVVADTLQGLISDESALLALVGIRSYDRYLSEHSMNVCILSMVLARDLGLDAATTLEVGISAMLHDVGKVFVANDIITKPGKLTEEEWEQIRRHPAEGARALAGLTNLPALASTIALEHHVYEDGSGYPAIPAQGIHLLSRLVSIVDTYDALTTDRPYRERWTPQQAIAYMLYEVPDRYDRQLMARFATRARLHPISALVKLASGDVAVVTGGTFKEPERPIVRILSHSPLNATVIDLSKNTDPSMEIASAAQPVEALLPFVDNLLTASSTA